MRTTTRRDVILAIDPGYELSAWVLYDGTHVLEHAIEENQALLQRLTSGAWRVGEIDAIVFESIESYGMAVGREVFETIFWTGRLFERALYRTGDVVRLARRIVKLHLCQSARAQDSNVRMALCDRFGGPTRAIGKKKTPGPLYGVKSHEWQALALGVVWWDLNVTGKKSGAQDTGKTHATIPVEGRSRNSRKAKR